MEQIEDPNMRFDPMAVIRHGATLALTATTALILVGCNTSGNSSPDQSGSSGSSAHKLEDGSYDLITDQHWQMAGVTVDDSTAQSRLKVTSTQLAIVKQDGSAGYANPSVNLYGTRLSKDGDFSVTAKVSNIKGEAALSLYGTPPLIEDEFRAELGTLDMTINGRTFNAKVSDQNGDKNAEVISRSIPARSSANGEHTVTVTDKDGNLSFSVDETIVGGMADDGIFDTDQVWFGMDARTPGGSFTVDQLSAQEENDSKLAVYDTRTEAVTIAKDGLSSLLQNHRKNADFGVAVAPGPLMSDPEYRKLLSNFNMWSLENVGKFQFVHPLPGNESSSYNMADRDAVIAMAQKAGVKVNAHALLFKEANPQWYQDLPQSELRQVDLEHIKTIMDHDKQFGNTVVSYDVVNEPMEWLQNRSQADLIAAYQMAHQTNPKAQLWLNDYGMETDSDKRGQVISLAQKLRAAGVPVGVSFQAHIDDTDTVTKDTFNQAAADVKNAGFKVRFSEVDISEDDEHAVTKQILQTYISDPNVSSVTVWGVTDKYTSGGDVDDKGIFTPGFGVMYDENYKPTPQYHDVKNLLK